MANQILPNIFFPNINLKSMHVYKSKSSYNNILN